MYLIPLAINTSKGASISIWEKGLELKKIIVWRSPLPNKKRAVLIVYIIPGKGFYFISLTPTPPSLVTFFPYEANFPSFCFSFLARLTLEVYCFHLSKVQTWIFHPLVLNSFLGIFMSVGCISCPFGFSRCSLQFHWALLPPAATLMGEVRRFGAFGSHFFLI